MSIPPSQLSNALNLFKRFAGPTALGAALGAGIGSIANDRILAKAIKTEAVAIKNERAVLNNHAQILWSLQQSQGDSFVKMPVLSLAPKK